MSLGTFFQQSSRIASGISLAMAAYAATIVIVGLPGPRLRYTVIAMLFSGVIAAGCAVAARATADSGDRPQSLPTTILAAALVGLATLITISVAAGGGWPSKLPLHFIWALSNTAVTAVVILRIARMMRGDSSAADLNQKRLMMQICGVVILWIAWLFAS